MEVINRIVFDIKEEKDLQEVLKDLISLVEYLIRKGEVSHKLIETKLKSFGSQIKKQCPNAFPILNFISLLIIANRKT